MKRRSLQTGLRRGFTLVELLAASIVMSMLLVVLLHFSRTSARQMRRAESLRKKRPSVALVGEQILRDLQNADGFGPAPGGVSLFGAIASDPVTGRSRRQLANVTYTVRNLRGLSVLVRTEQQPRGESHDRVVWVGAGHLAIQSESTSLIPMDLRATGGLAPMPAVVRAELQDTDGTVIWSQRVRHHQEIR